MSLLNNVKVYEIRKLTTLVTKIYNIFKTKTSKVCKALLN